MEFTGRIIIFVLINSCICTDNGGTSELRSLSMSKESNGQLFISDEDFNSDNWEGTGIKQGVDNPKPTESNSNQEFDQFAAETGQNVGLNGDRSILERLYDMAFGFATLVAMLGFQIFHYYWPNAKESLRIARDSTFGENCHYCDVITNAIEKMSSKFDTK